MNDVLVGGKGTFDIGAGLNRYKNNFMKNTFLIFTFLIFSSCSINKQNEQSHIYDIILNNEFPKYLDGKLLLNNNIIEYNIYKETLCTRGINYEKSDLLCSFFENSKLKNINDLNIKRKHYVFNSKDVTSYNSMNYKKETFGVISFSNVLKTHKSPELVLVYVEYYSSSWDGFGKFYLLEKRKNEWMIKNVYTSWQA